MTTIGSLFSGYSGLDMAVESVTGGHTVWYSDIDPGACKILAYHWPHVPNLGDISSVDWSQVEPVDIITGGFPCQDVSMAGRRAGLSAGTRSGLWAMMATAVDHLRPSLVVIENVRGLLSAAADSNVEPCPWCMGDADGEPPLRALGAVLGDLASAGYDAAWHGLTAASVGAPHGRFRVFLIAWPQSGDTDSSDRDGRTTAGFQRQAGPEVGPAEDADRTTCGERWVAAPGQAQGRWARPDAGGSGGTRPADTDRAGLAQRSSVTGDDGPEQSTAQRSDRNGAAAADTIGVQPERRGVSRDVGSAQAGDEGTGRQRERVRDTTVDSGPASPDAPRAKRRGAEPTDLGATIGSAAEPRERVGTDWGQLRRDQGGIDEYASHSNARQGVPSLRGDVQSEAIRRSVGEHPAIPNPGVLLAGMREQPGGRGQGHAPLAGAAAPQGDVRPLRDGQRPACASHRPEPSQQRPGQPANSLRIMPSKAALVGGPSEAVGECGKGSGHGCSAWGQFAQAIHRWEVCLGRIAPSPTELSMKGTRRLSPRAVEFMMGLPDGHVTAVPGLTRNEQLKALGNGVVVQQAEAALRVLLNAMEAA